MHCTNMGLAISSMVIQSERQKPTADGNELDSSAVGWTVWGSRICIVVSRGYIVVDLISFQCLSTYSEILRNTPNELSFLL